MINPDHIDKIKGMSVEDAEKYLQPFLYSVRVVARDGEAYMVTCDHRLDRVNVTVQDDKVIGWSIG